MLQGTHFYTKRKLYPKIYIKLKLTHNANKMKKLCSCVPRSLKYFNQSDVCNVPLVFSYWLISTVCLKVNVSKKSLFTCVMVLLWQPVHLDILQSCKCIAPAHHTIKPPGVSPALQLGVRNTFLMALFHCPSLRVMVRIRKWRIN